MATAVHIPACDLTDVKSLLDMARGGVAVIIDAEGESFRLCRSPGKTVDEIFANPRLASAIDGLDESWAEDLGQVLSLRKHDPDPWA